MLARGFVQVFNFGPLCMWVGTLLYRKITLCQICQTTSSLRRSASVVSSVFAYKG